MRALLDPDDRLSGAAEAVIAAAVGAATGRVRVRGGLLARLLTSRRRVGIAFGATVILHPALHRRGRDGWDVRVLRLLAHEAAHVRQYRELGTGRFLRRYVAEYLRGRLGGLGHLDAYRAITFEVEARAAARRADAIARTGGP